MDKFSDLLRLILPLSKDKKEWLNLVSRFLRRSDFKEFKYWYKQGKVNVEKLKMGSKSLGAQEEYLFISTEEEDPELLSLCDCWNDKIKEKVREHVFKEFSGNAKNIVKLIAPNIIGLDAVKEAVALQLFATDRTHILLLGDPGTGKTDILSSCADLAPISSFGLGSGTSGAGLTITFKGDEMLKGLLPMADKGLCCVDELNLMKEADRAGLLNAMEKGFVTYDKGNKHVKLNADIKVLASANPKGDQFAGWLVETLKKQLPFDPALLSRFHLVYLIRRPDTKDFVKITKKIVSGKRKTVKEEEIEFVKDYIEYSKNLKVDFNKKLEPIITKFVEDLKTNEKKYLMEVSPRLVLGIVRLSKASARMHLRSVVSEKDVRDVLRLLENAIEIKKEP